MDIEGRREKGEGEEAVVYIFLYVDIYQAEVAASFVMLAVLVCFPEE